MATASRCRFSARFHRKDKDLAGINTIWISDLIVLVADFVILVAVAIVETGLAHAALQCAAAGSILPPRSNGN
jgi:hypothetical protein